MATGPYVSVNGNIAVNNGSLTCPAAGGGRQVLVTPIVGGSQQKIQADRAISASGGVLFSTLPVISTTAAQNPSAKSERTSKGAVENSYLKLKDPAKIFTLRNLDLSTIKSCADLKAVIKWRLSIDITAIQYDVEYVRGSNVVRIRTTENLDELLDSIKGASHSNAL